MEDNKTINSEIIDYGSHVMSCKLINREDCERIINFIEGNLDKFYKNVPKKNYNTNTLELNISTSDEIDGGKEIDSLICKYVSTAINLFVKQISNPGNITRNISDSGYQLRKVIGETVQHQDGPEIIITENLNNVKYRVATLVISLKDTGDKLVFPDQNISVPLGEGDFVFFPPYWTHPHYTEWSGTDGYRIQTWITNTVGLHN